MVNKVSQTNFLLWLMFPLHMHAYFYASNECETYNIYSIMDTK